MFQDKIELYDMRGNVLYLGKAGEGNRYSKLFMTSKWRAEYPDGVISLHVTPPKGVSYFAALTETEDGNVIWTVNDADTAYPGCGEIELILSEDTSDVTIKSETMRTVINESPSQTEPGDPPEPHVPWWEKVLQLIASGTGTGEGGVSPTVTVTAITGGHRLTITDVLGAKTIDVMDGVSPNVEIDAITGGHRVTITDADGAKTFDVMDGQDGAGGGSGAAIDDTTPSTTTTYSSKKIDELLDEQKEAIDAKGDLTDEQIQTAVDSYLSGIAISGISAEEKAVFLTLFKAAAYTSDVSATIAQLEALWGGTVEPDEPVVPTTYTITNTLTNATSDNTTSVITEGGIYTATITADEGYTLTGASVSVTMGGVDITADAYAEGVITIASVTGNVVITVTAVEEAAEDIGWTSGVPYTLEWTDGYNLNSTGALIEDANRAVTQLLPCEGASALLDNKTSYGVHQYDADGNFLRKTPASYVIKGPQSVDRDATFMRYARLLTEKVATVITPYKYDMLTESTAWESGKYYASNWTTGYSVNASDGSLGENANSSATDLMICYGATSLQFFVSGRTFITWYDGNKTVLSQEIRQNKDTAVPIPEGAYYFRLSRNDTYSNDWVMLT